MGSVTEKQNFTRIAIRAVNVGSFRGEFCRLVRHDVEGQRDRKVEEALQQR